MLSSAFVVLTLCSAARAWESPALPSNTASARIRRTLTTSRATSSEEQASCYEAKRASRRQWLQAAGAVSAVGVPALTAHASPSFMSSLQGPMQDFLAPGHWLGQFTGLNSRTETWEFLANSPAEVSAALVEVFNELTPERRDKLLIPEFTISQADAAQVHVLTWTKAEWLDTLDVRFSNARFPGTGTVATACFYATGFFPTSVPLAPSLNVAMT